MPSQMKKAVAVGFGGIVVAAGLTALTVIHTIKVVKESMYFQTHHIALPLSRHLMIQDYAARYHAFVVNGLGMGAPQFTLPCDWGTIAGYGPLERAPAPIVGAAARRGGGSFGLNDDADVALHVIPAQVLPYFGYCAETVADATQCGCNLAVGVDQSPFIYGGLVTGNEFIVYSGQTFYEYYQEKRGRYTKNGISVQPPPYKERDFRLSKSGYKVTFRNFYRQVTVVAKNSLKFSKRMYKWLYVLIALEIILGAAAAAFAIGLAASISHGGVKPGVTIFPIKIHADADDDAKHGE
ncbi:hypothetical protein M885DRAFT_590408 [Pelagophyceae sp. CCMP2097]|nr:hypothetical protein M885DRAFT_590408 [Pelagophyceae sp. CCMP2097]